PLWPIEAPGLSSSGHASSVYAGPHGAPWRLGIWDSLYGLRALNMPTFAEHASAGYNNGGAYVSRPWRLVELRPKQENPSTFLAPSVGMTIAMARGRTSHHNPDSRATRSSQTRADSHDQVPPVDENATLVGATDNVPISGVHATTQEIAELRGQVQYLVGVCQGLQAQLARQPTPTIPPQLEQQAKSSRRRLPALLARQERREESSQHSRKAPSVCRTPERQHDSPRRSIVAPLPLRSVVDANSHGSKREGSVHSDQELARCLHHIVDLERRMDAMVQRSEGRALEDDDLDFRSPFLVEILEAQVSLKLPLPSIAPYDEVNESKTSRKSTSAVDFSIRLQQSNLAFEYSIRLQHSTTAFDFSSGSQQSNLAFDFSSRS
ncbi:hypothetical protein Taro_036975, partial [Colocasia esculenta]|nr:hypothetical protein [Colocasia esculenta]